MRIGVDARPLHRPTTGIGRYTTEILLRLVTSGHDFFLYSPQPVSAAALLDSNANLRTGDLKQPQLGSLFAQWRYPRWIRQDAIDVFWSPRHHLPLLSSAPSVVTVHDLVWRKAPDSMIALGRTLERALMPPSLKKADAIIAVSRATRDDILEFLPDLAEKVTVIHEAGFASGNRASSRQNTILFVGTFEPRKNIPRLLEAFSRLISAGLTSHRLILAGNEGWKQDVSGLVDDLAVRDYVEIERPGSQEALESLYAEADFVVQPALYEGFGLPILEAMSFGKPVITSNVSSMPEVAGDAALLVNPQSVGDIAAAMQRLITDRELYDTLAARAKPQAARFSWDVAAENTLKVLEMVGTGTSRA